MVPSQMCILPMPHALMQFHRSSRMISLFFSQHDVVCVISKNPKFKFSVIKSVFNLQF